MCFNDHMRRLFGFDEAVIFTGAINSLLQLPVSYITMGAFAVFYIVIMTYDYGTNQNVLFFSIY